MAGEERALTFGLVAGEASGDNLGGPLVRALAHRAPGARFVGVAGPRMSEAGCEPWYPSEALAVMGLAEILRHLPRLLRLRRELLGRLAAAEPDALRAAPTNPEYLTVKSQIDATQRELAALQMAAARARSQIYQYESGMSAAPGVEQEYADLTRNRDVLQGQFSDIQAKLHEANIARNLETEQQGERFSQIRRPFAASTPFSPNRIGIILLGLVLGGGLAVGLAAAAESSDPSVRGANDLAAITQLPAIASVPVMLNADDRRRQHIWWGSYAAVLLVATAFVAMTVVGGMR